MSTASDEKLTATYVRQRLSHQGIDVDIDEARGVLDAAGWIAPARLTVRRLVAGEGQPPDARDGEAQP